MLMLWEFKKNLRFFLSMAAVIVLLLSAGISLFNFSFEITRTVRLQLEEEFVDGYGIRVNRYIPPDTALPGVAQYRYSNTRDKCYPKTNIDPEGNASPYGFSWTTVYAFSDILHKNFAHASADIDDFLIAGRLWTAADNEAADGVFPIFLSDIEVARASENGHTWTVGSHISLTEILILTGDEFVLYAEVAFVVTGIYKKADVPWEYDIPYAVIPLQAELTYRNHTDNLPAETVLMVNSLDDFKKFSTYANKNGIEYAASIEEDLALVSLFSTIFSVLGIAILLLCGAICYVYCGMYLHRRIDFIGLIKAMGMPSGQIAMQFFVLLLLLLGAAFLLGNLFSVVLTTHFSTLAYTLFEYELHTGFNLISQLIFAALTVLTAGLSVLLLHRKISKISISQTLTQKE